MIWIIIISLFISLLVWLLVGPVIFILRTETNRYHLVLPGIFKAALIPTNELFQIRGWIFFIPFKFNPFKERKRKTKKKVRQPKKRKRLIKKPKDIQMINELIHSFHIKTLQLDLDTDDFMLNAWLVPAFSFINTENIQMRVNFEGTSSLVLDLRTHLGYLLWIVIRNKYKSVFNL